MDVRLALAVVMAGLVQVTDVTACPVSVFYAGDLDAVMPPEPTIYVEVAFVRPAEIADLLEAVPPRFRDERGPIAVVPRMVVVGDQVLLAITIPRTEGTIEVAFDNLFVPQRIRISPTDAPAPWSSPVGDVLVNEHAETIDLRLGGAGVGYWEVRTAGCQTVAALPRRDDYRPRSRPAAPLVARLPLACIDGRPIDVIAHYVDGSSEHLTDLRYPAAAPRKAITPSRWLGLAGLLAVAAAVVLARRARHPTHVPS